MMVLVRLLSMLNSINKNGGEHTIVWQHISSRREANRSQAAGHQCEEDDEGREKAKSKEEWAHVNVSDDEWWKDEWMRRQG